MDEDRSEQDHRAEDAQVAIRDGIERARELLSERLAVVQQENLQAEPPNPAS
jgi:hypothetical protein